ncbi:hypothetical protein F9L07_09255 [Pimelobacter simplex]|uniref:Uncharacterized protein n=1 Tax=Nocardioides simplex TaxID=2045 RepID=A0A7J5E1F2_NOCSI|nr:hypothetical protein [Pimelobacter simplex]KAB2812008.1 hypothetical protein F9L07_09255 [Pimelobacter simplex]
MSSPRAEIRNVPPWLAGLVVITCLVLGGVPAAVLVAETSVPGLVTIPVQVVGMAGGYLLSRTVLRRLYAPR